MTGTTRTISRGVFFTFEGIDGSGKSVQARALAKNLSDLQYPVISLREPGSTAIAEKIRDILLDRTHISMTSVTELLLYEAARAQLVHEAICPALERKEVVICDRFYDSTTAYQGYGRALSLPVIESLNRLACQNVVPDRTFVFDIPWSVSLRRRRKEANRADRMENQDPSFFRSIQQGYHALAGKEANRIRILDGTQSVKSLEQDVLEDVLKILRKVEKVTHK